MNNLLEEFIRPTKEEEKNQAKMHADLFKINLKDEQKIQSEMCIIDKG
jgi:hypothetical protein